MRKRAKLHSKTRGGRSLSVEELLELEHAAHRKTFEKRLRMYRAGWDLIDHPVGFDLKRDPLLSHNGAHLALARQTTLVAIVQRLFFGRRMREYYEKESISMQPVVMFMALRMLMSARRTHLSGSHDPQRDAYVALRKELKPACPRLKLPGVRMYEKWALQMELPVDVIKGQLSEDWADLVEHGESVALDEKLRHFTGLSPYSKSVPSKPDAIGLETAQMAVSLEGTADPFVFGLYPLTSSKQTNESVPMTQIASWALGLLRTSLPLGCPPVVVTDCMYNSAAVRELYFKQRGHFLMAIRPNHCGDLDILLGTDVAKRPATVYARHRPSGLIVCRHWPSDAKSAYKTVTTNAMVEAHGPIVDPESPPIYKHYALLFNTCDKANKTMSGMWWPYRTSGHSRRFSDFALDMGFLNLYTACKYSSVVEPDVRMDRFLEKAAFQLLVWLSSHAKP